MPTAAVTDRPATLMLSQLTPPRGWPATPGSVAAARASARISGGWFAGLALVFIAPVGARLVAGGAPSTLWAQLVVLTGLLAASALVCAVVVPSRLRSLGQSVGITAVLYVHRFMGIFAASMAAAHVGFVVADHPANVGLIANLDAPLRAKAGAGAALAVAGLIVLGVTRHRVRQRYELWRWTHLSLAVVSIALAALHIWLINKLVQDALLRGVLLCLGAVVLVTLTYRWAIRPALGTSRHFVAGVRSEGGAVCTLVLEPRGRPLRFAPGQFIWLRLSRAAAAQEHPFTIASSAHLGGRTEITLRSTGDFGRTLAALRPGTPVWVDGPHGAFTDDFSPAPGLAMIATGVGVTPMMSMLRTLAHRRDRRPLLLVHAARQLDGLVFRDELASLAQRLDLTVVEVLRRPPPGWRGAVGEVSTDLLAAVLPRPEQRAQLAYFVCGPPALVTAALGDLHDLGVPAERINTEQFDA